MIPSICFYAFVIRFYSVQTQLKTQNENTLVIMKKMRRAKQLEIFSIALLTVDWMTDFFLTYNDALYALYEISISDGLYTILSHINCITDLSYVTIFFVVLMQVNLNISVFFNDVGVKDYPRNFITVSLVLYFLIFALGDIFTII